MDLVSAIYITLEHTRKQREITYHLIIIFCIKNVFITYSQCKFFWKIPQNNTIHKHSLTNRKHFKTTCAWKKTAMYTPQKFRNYENRMSLPAKHIVAQRLGEKIKDRSLWPTASWEYEGLGKKSQPTSTDRKCFVCRNS